MSSMDNNKTNTGRAPITKPATEDTPPAAHYNATNAKGTNTASAEEKWSPPEDKKTEQMKEFFKEDNAPKVKVDQEEFEKDCAKYGLKTLKNSRWADPPQDKKTEQTSSSAKPKTLKDSRWAN